MHGKVTDLPYDKCGVYVYKRHTWVTYCSIYM